jgi:TonB-linked SusC/RagA family outer membrane protein
MRKILFLSVMLMLTGLVSWAQRTVTGRVTDASGAPIPSASVQIQNTQVGTVTKDDGSFSITIPANGRTLIISAVGMATQEVAIGNQTTLTVSLQSGNQQNMQEVVVVGYGTQRRRDITGSLSTVKGQAVAEKPVQSFEQALAGRAAGVQITIPSGVLNSPPVFRIRGTNSISLSSQPLIVVDGIPVQTGDFSSTNSAGNALANINPNDIESIDIAKDAASAAIYGSRAANGVVFITTKKGRSGKPRVSYDTYIGWTEPIRLPEILNAQQYTDYKNLAIANAHAIRPNSVSFTYNGVANTLPQYKLSTDANGNTIDTRWYDHVYRTGFQQNHNLNVSGGSDNTNYYLSAGYTDQQGIIRRNDFKRINALLNIDSRINNFITVGGKLSFSNERNLAAESSGSLSTEAYSTAGLGRNAVVNAPNVSPYNNDGSYNIGASFIGPMSNIVPSNQVGFYNPVVALALNRSNNELDHLQSNVYVQIKPLSWISLRSVYGIDNISADNDIFYNPLHGTGQGSQGQAIAVFNKSKRWVWTNTAQFDYTFADRHEVSLLAGNEQQRNTSRSYGIDRTILSDPAYNVVQAGFTTNNTSGLGLGENYLLSYFGRLNYNFNRKYYISANVRQDEYSALGVKKGVFYGLSAGWEITKENFWQSAGLDRTFSSFKLRGSYGKVGNINGIGNFASFSTFGSGLYGGVGTLSYASTGNNRITWETSKKTDIGFSFGLFKERLTGDIAFYKNDIDGLLLNVSQSPSTGIPNAGNAIFANAGSMYNKGIEITLNGAPILAKDFSWNSSFNIAFNKNEVTALAPGLNEVIFPTGTATTGENVNRTAPGYSVGYLWVVRTGGVDAATGRRIFYNKAGRAVTYQHITPFVNGVSGPTMPQWTYMDNGAVAPAITQGNDAVMYQNTQPKTVGGWSNNFRYKGFDLDVLLTYQLGFYVSYGSNAGLHDQRYWNNAVDVLGHWKKPGDQTDFVRPIYTDNVSYGNTIPIDFNMFKGDFVKLKNLTLGYTLPQSIMNRAKISRARIYVSGQNLAMITKYPGPDPEVSSNGVNAAGQGSDRNTVPNSRAIIIGLNLGF